MRSIYVQEDSNIIRVLEREKEAPASVYILTLEQTGRQGAVQLT